MENYFVALIIFIAAYVLVKFILELVEKLKPVADVLAILSAAFAALLYVGAIK